MSTHDAQVMIVNWVLTPLSISGGLMLIVGVCLKIYRTVNKRSQPKWGEPEFLTVGGFFVFAIPQIVSEYFFPVF